MKKRTLAGAVGVAAAAALTAGGMAVANADEEAPTGSVAEAEEADDRDDDDKDDVGDDNSEADDDEGPGAKDDDSDVGR